jgi:hypothetical protein
MEKRENYRTLKRMENKKSLGEREGDCEEDRVRDIKCKTVRERERFIDCEGDIVRDRKCYRVRDS